MAFGKGRRRTVHFRNVEQLPKAAADRRKATVETGRNQLPEHRSSNGDGGGGGGGHEWKRFLHLGKGRMSKVASNY